MRNIQKQEVLKFIDSLYQAHEEIKEALDKGSAVLAQNMVAECQEYAITLGSTIEKLEANQCVTVSYIEEYCELLYRIHGELGSAGYNAGKICKSLKKQLIKIENSVRNDITVRKEVAFFPYKASMWDSLESVYLAAKEDPDCDAYCVPIPYYELNPDHSMGQMHYEGGEYPKNIEITDWRSYNFEERRPDVIYIHNPYDDWNLVTSVHPRYYAKNLKQYTEKLVYIPYFILGEIEPDNQDAIEGMKHFCFAPGIIYADKVVVQSENMRRIYINEYSKAAKEHGLTGKHLDRKYLEEKFLGIGSPKMDKVLGTIEKDIEMPQEWLKIICRPDGSQKKIIFYNTGIAALLQHNEKWVEKIEDTLKIFEENQDEVVLLWRPHPLIESTMKSMRPNILEKYLEIKKQYLSQGWGIYDDTADLDRAIAISDAYYGDGSSVVQLYEQTGKPVMLQNVEILY